MATLLLVVMALACLGLGLTGVLFPRVTRRLINVFVHRAPTRFLGALVLIAGGLLFRHADDTAVPFLGKLLGFVMFVAGGTQLVIPDLAIVFNEWWVERRTLYERGISVVYLAIAVFFIVSVSPSRYVETAGARLRPVYDEIAASYWLLLGKPGAEPRREMSPEETERLRRRFEELTQAAKKGAKGQRRAQPSTQKEKAL